jgi:hypothetical protein
VVFVTSEVSFVHFALKTFDTNTGVDTVSAVIPPVLNHAAVIFYTFQTGAMVACHYAGLFNQPA